MPGSFLVILCNRTSPSERLGHVFFDRGSFQFRSNLGATYTVFINYVVILMCIHRIHKWPPRGTVWIRAHENEVGKATVMLLIERLDVESYSGALKLA